MAKLDWFCGSQQKSMSSCLFRVCLDWIVTVNGVIFIIFQSFIIGNNYWVQVRTQYLRAMNDVMLPMSTDSLDLKHLFRDFVTERDYWLFQIYSRKGDTGVTPYVLSVIYRTVPWAEERPVLRQIVLRLSWVFGYQFELEWLHVVIMDLDGVMCYKSSFHNPLNK